MIQVPLYEVKNDLSRYLRIAEKEDVIITRHGVPAGILIGIEDPEDTTLQPEQGEANGRQKAVDV